MNAVRNPRWLISFADLCLLLLGFFVLLHASRDSAAAAASMRAAFGEPASRDLRSYRAATLFEPGEAVLRVHARRRLEATGALAAARGRRIRIASVGAEPATPRFDGWELAAARAAAVARAIAGGGLAPARIDISVAPADVRRNGQILHVSAEAAATGAALASRGGKARTE